MGKSLEFINWDNLINIPFAECEIKKDEATQDIDIYYREELVFTEHKHIGHFLSNAIIMFQTIKNKNAEWVNLHNLWILWNCIRESLYHGLGLEEMIFGEDYVFKKYQSMTKTRLFAIVKKVQRKNPYAKV